MLHNSNIVESEDQDRVFWLLDVTWLYEDKTKRRISLFVDDEIVRQARGVSTICKYLRKKMNRHNPLFAIIVLVLVRVEVSFSFPMSEPT